MKKNLITILVIFFIIASLVGYFMYQMQKQTEEANKINKEYNTYYEKTILGTDLASIINKTIDLNEKNKIEKNDKKVYQENEKNSIKIYIKFLENEDEFLMESISNKGIDSFIYNFASASFKCTSIEYHEKTKQVKCLKFEQVQVQ